MTRRGALLVGLLMVVACSSEAASDAEGTAAEGGLVGLAAYEAAYEDAVQWIDDPDLLAHLEQVKDQTIAYADVSAAEADGYERSPNGCDPGAGLHYINRALVDDETGAVQPEVLMYAVEEDGLRLVGVEYFVHGSNLDPRPEILGQPARGPTVIPTVGSIYWIHVWLYDRPAGGLFEWFNHSVVCVSDFGD